MVVELFSVARGSYRIIPPKQKRLGWGTRLDAFLGRSLGMTVQITYTHNKLMGVAHPSASRGLAARISRPRIHRKIKCGCPVRKHRGFASQVEDQEHWERASDHFPTKVSQMPDSGRLVCHRFC